MSRYARDPAYPKPPRWGRLYDRHFPRDTCPASRHVRLMADALRNTRSPIRKAVIDAGLFDPDHWAGSMESAVQSLWRERAKVVGSPPQSADPS